MTTVTTRAGKGAPLTNAEIDQNFIDLVNNKLELIVNGTTSGATITPASSDSQYNVTALAVNATVEAPSGTPVHGHKLLLRIKDDGTARTLAWNAIFRELIALPTTTVAGKVLYVGFTYNDTDSKWDVIAVTQET
jgi:hypothetical protein